jgi:hypothetical protein
VSGINRTAAWTLFAFGILLRCAHGAPAKATTEISVLRSALRAQTRAYSLIREIHFVATLHVVATAPKSGAPFRYPGGWGTYRFKDKKITYRRRYEFWGDGARYRIDFSQTGPGAGGWNVIETWNGTNFEVFDPGSRILQIWPHRPNRYVGMPALLSPLLVPLEFLQPPAPSAVMRWRNWLTFNRLRHDVQSVVKRCRGVTILPGLSSARGIWGRATGAAIGIPTGQAEFKIFVSQAAPRLVVEIRSTMLHPGVAWGWSSKSIHYKPFKVGRHTVWLPAEITTPDSSSRERFKYLQVGVPFSPSVYAINFKLARKVVMEQSGKIVPANPAR